MDSMMIIPQRQYQANVQQRNHSPIDPMEFVTNHGKGVCLADIYAHTVIGLLGADEQPLQGFCAKVTYRIEVGAFAI